MVDISLEAFLKSDLNKIFLDRQPCQDEKVSGANSVHIFRVCWWFGRSKWWL